MTGHLPLRPSIEYTPQSRSVCDLDDTTATDVFETLSSETARAFVCAIEDDPATASDVAGRVGTTVQNAHYHLKNLCDAGLVTTAGTWYSAKGTEMPVYALSSERIEIRLRTSDRSTSSDANRRREAAQIAVGSPPEGD